MLESQISFSVHVLFPQAHGYATLAPEPSDTVHEATVQKLVLKSQISFLVHVALPQVQG